jgi:hypothetical protein
MNPPLHDIASAIVVIGIIISVVRVIPVVVVVTRSHETAGEEASMEASAMVKAAAAEMTDIPCGETIALNGAEPAAGGGMREASPETSATEAAAASATEASKRGRL